jgi:ribosomal protein L25 (general stress protein Ctc)
MFEFWPYTAGRVQNAVSTDAPGAREGQSLACTYGGQQHNPQAGELRNAHFAKIMHPEGAITPGAMLHRA